MAIVVTSTLRVPRAAHIPPVRVPLLRAALAVRNVDLRDLEVPEDLAANVARMAAMVKMGAPARMANVDLEVPLDPVDLRASVVLRDPKVRRAKTARMVNVAPRASVVLKDVMAKM